MRSATGLALLAAVGMLSGAAMGQKVPKEPKNPACPLELIFPGNLLLMEGQPQKVTLKVRAADWTEETGAGGEGGGTGRRAAACNVVV